MQNNTFAAMYVIIRNSFAELLRNRLGLILLFIIPALFLIAADLTAGNIIIPVKIGSGGIQTTLFLSQKKISTVFMSSAVAGFLTGFYTSYIFHNTKEYYRNAVACGLPAALYLVSVFFFFMFLNFIISLFISALILVLMNPLQSLNLLLSYLLLGLIYGLFGCIAGALSKDFLIALLPVVLLVNFDAGWLQNPVFYTYAQKSEFIKWLPAYHPCQLLFFSVFTTGYNAGSLLSGFIYGSGFFLLLLAIELIKLRNLNGRTA